MGSYKCRQCGQGRRMGGASDQGSGVLWRSEGQWVQSGPAGVGSRGEVFTLDIA